MALLAGIRAGRSWIAGSAEVTLKFSAKSGEERAGIGEQLATGGRPVTVNLEVQGVDGGMVSFHTDLGEAHRETFSGSGHIAVWKTGSDKAGFVRCEVRYRDGSMAALSNPILLDRPSQPGSGRPQTNLSTYLLCQGVSTAFGE